MKYDICFHDFGKPQTVQMPTEMIRLFDRNVCYDFGVARFCMEMRLAISVCPVFYRTGKSPFQYVFRPSTGKRGPTVILGTVLKMGTFLKKRTGEKPIIIELIKTGDVFGIR